MSMDLSINPMIDLSSECEFQTSRSSGPGGQNVNKVNTKVELRFNIPNSELLNDEQKEKLLLKLAGKITSEGILIVSSQRYRSQLSNKEEAILKFQKLIAAALAQKKKRKATRPTQTSIENRLINKRIKAEVKQSRQKPDYS